MSITSLIQFLDNFKGLELVYDNNILSFYKPVIKNSLNFKVLELLKQRNIISFTKENSTHVTAIAVGDVSKITKEYSNIENFLASINISKPEDEQKYSLSGAMPFTIAPVKEFEFATTNLVNNQTEVIKSISKLLDLCKIKHSAESFNANGQIFDLKLTRKSNELNKIVTYLASKNVATMQLSFLKITSSFDDFIKTINYIVTSNENLSNAVKSMNDINRLWPNTDEIKITSLFTVSITDKNSPHVTDYLAYLKDKTSILNNCKNGVSYEITVSDVAKFTSEWNKFISNRNLIAQSIMATIFALDPTQQYNKNVIGPEINISLKDISWNLEIISKLEASDVISKPAISDNLLFVKCALNSNPASVMAAKQIMSQQNLINDIKQYFANLKSVRFNQENTFVVTSKQYELNKVYYDDITSNAVGLIRKIDDEYYLTITDYFKLLKIDTNLRKSFAAKYLSDINKKENYFALPKKILEDSASSESTLFQNLKLATQGELSLRTLQNNLKQSIMKFLDNNIKRTITTDQKNKFTKWAVNLSENADLNKIAIRYLNFLFYACLKFMYSNTSDVSNNQFDSDFKELDNAVTNAFVIQSKDTMVAAENTFDKIFKNSAKISVAIDSNNVPDYFYSNDKDHNFILRHEPMQILEKSRSNMIKSFRTNIASWQQYKASSHNL